MDLDEIINEAVTRDAELVIINKENNKYVMLKTAAQLELLFSTLELLGCYCKYIWIEWTDEDNGYVWVDDVCGHKLSKFMRGDRLLVDLRRLRDEESVDS